MAGWAKKLNAAKEDSPATQFITQQVSPTPQLRGKKKRNLVQIGFRCDPALKERLNKYCEEHEVYCMDIISVAVEDYLSSHGG